MRRRVRRASSRPISVGAPATADIVARGARSRLARCEAGTFDGMEQRVSLITLGVTDVSRSRRFYERLGWRGQETDGTVFFQAGGIAVVLWGRDELAADSGVEDGGGPFGGIALAQNVRSEDDVRRIVADAEAAGATVTRSPAPTFYGGFAACFTDPDGHVWEIAHNPGFTLADDGSLVLPDFGTS